MGMLKQLLDRLTKRDGRGEDDVVGDPARVDARSEHGVGRIAADDDLTKPTGAELRDESSSSTRPQ